MKAREYWIAHPYIDEKGKEHDFVYDEDPTWILENTGNKAIHVIEYLAYDELRRQNEVMKTRLDQAYNIIRQGKAQFAPHTTNSDVDVWLSDYQALSKCGKGGSV